MKSPILVPALALALGLLLLPTLVFAAPSSPWVEGFPPGLRPEAGPFLRAEIVAIQSELGAQKIGEIDAATLFSVRDRLSVAAQEDAYVKSTGMHSFLLPGLGQLETGDTASGIGFMAADLGVLTATFLIAYSVLPADLHFDRINYFGSSFSTITGAWNSHSVTDYLSTIGVIFGGMVIDQTIRHWSAAHARREAAQAVDEGRVTFTPRIGLGFMGFGAAY